MRGLWGVVYCSCPGCTDSATVSARRCAGERAEGQSYWWTAIAPRANQIRPIYGKRAIRMPAGVSRLVTDYSRESRQTGAVRSCVCLTYKLYQSHLKRPSRSYIYLTSGQYAVYRHSIHNTARSIGTQHDARPKISTLLDGLPVNNQHELHLCCRDVFSNNSRTVQHWANTN